MKRIVKKRDKREIDGLDKYRMLLWIINLKKTDIWGDNRI